MATGDLSDMVARIRFALPSKWFDDGSQATAATKTPVLDGFLAGPASVWSWVYSFLQWVSSQMRIATASGVLLDMIATDFFGTYITRRPGELDNALRSRIKAELFRPKGTRAAVIKAVTDRTGRAPAIFEPAYTFDTGGYGSIGMVAGTNFEWSGAGVAGAGGWGSLALPFQFFVTARRAIGGGIAGVAGYYLGSGWAGGGYGSLSNGGAGAGAIEWATLNMSLGQIFDQDIYDTINKVRPVATIAWTAITN